MSIAAAEPFEASNDTARDLESEGTSATTPFDLDGMVRRSQQGDGNAFAAIYEHYSPKVHKYLYFHLGGRADVADDLTADVFMKVFSKIESYESRGLPFSSWLYRIAHNRLIDQIRSQRRTQVVALDDAAELVEPRADRELERSLSRHEIGWALRKLTPERRSVLMVRYFEGLSVQEAADRLGKSEVAVKKLLVRALDDLRRLMDVQAPRLGARQEFALSA
ncbi:MAG: sigma-70 family RNA polymerase sigma factor [Chloroflexota bacterium]